MELDTDSLTTEQEWVTQPPKTEVTAMQWDSTNEWDLGEWLNGVNYQGRIGPNEWGGIYTNTSA